MPAPPLSDEEARQAVEAFNLHGNQTAASEALNLSRGAFQNRLRVAARRGLHLSNGAQEAMKATQLSGVEIAGGYRHVYDDEGKKTETVRWAVPKIELQLETVLERAATAFSDLPKAPAIPSPKHTS